MESLEENTDEIISIDFECLNCDSLFTTTKARLYCTIRCREDAKLIRYVRNAIKKGTFLQNDVKEAIDIRFAHATSKAGYYDSEARKIFPEKRAAVIERDDGLCRQCSNPGDEIDHIDGDSNELDNLQLLCFSCHIVKTKLKFKPITPEHPRYKEIKQRRESLLTRILEPTPERICYDPEKWDELYKQMMSEQWELLNRIKEDIQEIAENRDPSVDELISQELNELNELRSQKEALHLQEKEMIDQVLTPEILAQVEAIRSRFSDESKILNESIAPLEKRIKERVAHYGLKVVGENLQAVISKGSTSWDTKSLDEYSKTHPEILEFRIEGKEFVSIRPVKKKKD
jgi:5-methylcytosine-specific restriction endonuclease McrA